MFKMVYIACAMLAALATCIQLNAQETNVRFFGHMDAFYQRDFEGNESNSFGLGEHDVFITSKIHPRFSFLGETIIGLKSDGSFRVSMERVRIKYDYANNHSVIVGKMHTPINYWNDVYHHGRLFYPTIYRPHYFDLLVPIHTAGLRLQGQNLGGLKFGYDVVLGNGMSSTDQLDFDNQKSLTAAFHVKPRKGMRLGASYYRDIILGNATGGHAGHQNVYHTSVAEAYAGDIEYDMVSISLANFQNKSETLLEASFNRSQSDSLGAAYNVAAYMYQGFRLNNNHVVYTHLDYALIDENDLHTAPLFLVEAALGYRYEISYLLALKLELEYERLSYRHASPDDHMGLHGGEEGMKFEIQLAYGF